MIINDKNEDSIKVKILNGTNVPGLARKLRSVLIRDGINVVEFATSPFPKMNKTVVINQKGSIKHAIRISEIIGASKIYNVVDSTQLHSVLIIIGKDYIK